MSGVSSNDFTAVGSGVTDTGISIVSGSSGSSTYTVDVTGVSGNGTLRLDLNTSGSAITDTYGNTLVTAHTGDQSYTVDQTPPAVTSVSVPGSGTYISGQALNFTVNFSEAVTVTGTPELPITLTTGGTVDAQYVSGSGTTALTFRYTVIPGEQDLTGITVGSALIANGGTIADAATNNAVLTLNSVSSTSSVLVDSIVPVVSSVDVPTNGTYGTGQVLDFTVNFSENGSSQNVFVAGGTPYLDLTLTTGGTVHAAYVSGSGSSALVFAYTVASGNDDATGVTIGSLVLNGSTIKDAATNSAVLTLNNVQSTANVLVDAIPPTVTSIDTVQATTNNLSTEQFTVTFSTAVTGVDATDFTLVDTGTAAGNITSVTGSGTTWTVNVGSVTGDGTMKLNLNNSGDAITDSYNNTLVAAYSSGQTYTLEHTPPAVTSVTIPGNGTYVAGQNLDFTATFSEAVTVTGTPRIAISLTTGGTVYADYVSGSGTNTLTFQYTVAPGNQDLTGITTPGSVIDLNGGTIKDAATNSASGSGLNLTGETSLAGVDVDAIVPAVTSVVVPINGIYGDGQNMDFTVDFSKIVNVNTGGGTPYIQFTLTTGGAVDAVYISGSGSTSLVFRYVVISGELDTSGITMGNNLILGGSTIQDSLGNNTATALNAVGSTTGVQVDSILPTVTSIDTVQATTNNLSTEQFTVTFSTDVSLSPPNTSDFTLHDTGGVSGTIASVTAISGSVYTVTVTGATGDGTMRLDLNTSGSVITDGYGNPLTAAHTGDQTYTIEHTPPSATAMTVPGNGTYGNGQNLDFTVTFSEAVTVTGTPRLPITLTTGGTVYANYLSGSGTNTLTFQYVVVSGEQDLTGITNAASIDINSGTIKDAAGNNAVLAINAVEPSTAGVDVDSVMPVVTSVGVPATATYIAGQDLDFTVNLNKNVTVDTTGGTPYITLSLTDGGTVDAQYISGSGTSTLTFRYVVAPGNLDLTGVTLGSTIVLNSGTIDDTHGNAAVLALNGEASTSGVLVDAVPPVVSSIDTVGSQLTSAKSVTYTVTFSEAVTGVTASDFTLTETGVTGTIGSVTALSGSVYSVTVNNISGLGTMRLDLNNSGTGIADLATNAIASGYTNGEIYTFAAPGPVVVSVGVPAAATYVTGQELDFQVSFSEVVNVNTASGTPNIDITLNNGNVVHANYVSGSGGSTLTFSYVVAQGNIDTTGIVVGDTILATTGAINDAAGHNAALGLINVGNTSQVLIDGSDPSVASINIVGSQLTNASSVTYTVNFSENVSGVNANDFTLTTGGSATGSIASVTSVNGSTYTVTVNNVGGNGSLRLDLNPSSGIVDALGTGVPAFTGGASYTVDRLAPTVTSVGVPANGTYVGGQNLDFVVTYSAPLNVNTSGGEPSLTIDLANGRTVQAQLLSTAGDEMTFRYTVVNGDIDTTGIGIGATVNLNGATLQDTFGNSANLTLHNVASTALVDVDAVASTITSVQVPTPGTYTPGESLNLVVSFTQPVTVNTSGGTPEIAITLENGSTVFARYVSGSGSNELTFSYMVAPGNQGSTGISVATVILPNGGSIVGANSAPAGTSLNNVGSTANIDINPATPNNESGAGRGILSGCEGRTETPSVDPFIWLLPPDGDNQQGPGWSDGLPATSQTLWSSVPLLSAGQLGDGYAEVGTDRGSDSTIGSSGLSLPQQDAIDRIVNPSPFELPTQDNNQRDGGGSLRWQAPHMIEQPVTPDQSADATPLRHNVNAPNDNQPKNANAATDTAIKDQSLAHQQRAHSDQLAAPTAPPHGQTTGKASLNQQFSRYGKAAWERNQAVLVDHAQRIAQRRVG